ncbi:hypothetical protein MN0502_22170 [Arthrobacter sp. MN05-02]|nr:hypothetical protein MN0502_22170 [Arthrobacter sp. MN05-02]
MAIFTDPIREYAGFEPGDAEWLHLLVGDWQMVADLAFADLALWFPLDGGGYVALAHARPSTSHTVFHSDFVGERIRADLQPLVDIAWESQKIERSGETNWTTEMAMRVEAVPMVRNGRTLAVVTTPHGSLQFQDAVEARADLPAVRLRPPAHGDPRSVARLRDADRFPAGRSARG